VANRVLEKLPFRTRLALLHTFGRYAPWEEKFDFTPPPLGPGEVVGPPDFVGVGVQKAGTTWWFGLICDHPGVWARSDLHKERHYLDRFAAEAFGPEQDHVYHSWFPRRPGTITGEWTPDYFAFTWVPSLLARSAPDCRLLLILRDPVERFVSGMTHELRFGGSWTGSTMSEAVNRGLYCEQLRRWQEVWKPEQFLILQYEKCVRDPASELARTYRFLGLDDSHHPLGSTSPHEYSSPHEHSSPEDLDPMAAGRRRSKDQRVVLGPDARRRLVEIYSDDVLALVDLVPDLDISLWPNFRRLVRS